MVAFLNEEALDLTLKTGKMHYYSRTRDRLWMKGETSGHIQEVQEILIDCDQDTALFKIRQIGGAACHTGYNSCFYRRLEVSLIALSGGYSPVGVSSMPRTNFASAGPRRKPRSRHVAGHPIPATRAKVKAHVPLTGGAPLAPRCVRAGAESLGPERLLRNLSFAFARILALHNRLR